MKYGGGSIMLRRGFCSAGTGKLLRDDRGRKPAVDCNKRREIRVEVHHPPVGQPQSKCAKLMETNTKDFQLDCRFKWFYKMLTQRGAEYTPWMHTHFSDFYW